MKKTSVPLASPPSYDRHDSSAPRGRTVDSTCFLPSTLRPAFFLPIYDPSTHLSPLRPPLPRPDRINFLAVNFLPCLLSLSLDLSFFFVVRVKIVLPSFLPSFLRECVYLERDKKNAIDSLFWKIVDTRFSSTTFLNRVCLFSVILEENFLVLFYLIQVDIDNDSFNLKKFINTSCCT